MRKDSGFTLIELLIGIFIIALLSVIAVRGLTNFKLMQIHNGEVSSVLAVLNEARVRAGAGDNARNYSVVIDSNAKTLTLSRITTDPGDTAYTYTKTLDPRVSLNLSLASGSTITFTRFTGAVSNTGTILITTTGTGGNTRNSTIRIYPTGLSSKE